MATAKKASSTASKATATKKPAKSAEKAPAAKRDVNPAGSWPFPTGNRP